ncbi:MAG: DUF2508 family protein [Tissierellia bacterium]|nr:DUF2508 family protein [Tissierellia bacterium]
MFNFKEKNNEMEEMLESLRNAHNEWKDKEKFFQEVTDPDLVDIAIYEMEASKIKYIYLLKKLKEEMGIGKAVADNKIE